jgi:SagB-type dehydrogenase family enzyme
MASTSANRDTSRSWAYHNATKHSEWSIRASPHYLDFANQPISLKIYTTIDPIPLPRDADQTGVSALSAIASTGTPPVGSVPTLNDLARILYFSAGITKKKTYPGGEIYFRAASCTGALYEFELYVVCCDLQGLPAGVYHFGPGDFALRLLRAGDYRAILGHATAQEESVIHAPVVIICTGTYWRNAWKYRTRTYRHFGWDNGTMLANMLAMAAALRQPANLVLGFVDSEVNGLLDLNIEREVAFSLLTLGYTSATVAETFPTTPSLALPTVPLSQSEIDYPEMRDMHAASCLASAEEVAEWRTRAKEADGPLPPGDGGAKRRVRAQVDKSFSGPALTRPSATLSPGERAPAPATSTDTIERVILRRGSTRKFAREPITAEQLAAMLHASTRGIWTGFELLNHIYMIINAVDGLTPGAYFYEPKSGAFECLEEGNFRSDARHLGLQQDLPGDAAADVFFLSPLDQVLERFGNRGYRAVQLEAGILGGKLYLAAYALHLGATGLTFFDDDVIEFFSPHAEGKSAIFLVALGKSRKLN